ncbi:MAG: hypothetical protein JJ902_14130 [Roseibium sp.]|nr:hypothetical protein [Roseibium sp.]
MVLRPPRQTSKPPADPLAAALEHDILNEKVATLSRLNRKLEQALAQIPGGDPAADDDGQARLRKQRIAEAGEAVWHVMIQRELCGLHQHEKFFIQMNVPRTVRLCAGPLRISGTER